MRHVGIDVSARELVVALEMGSGEIRSLKYPNETKGFEGLTEVFGKRPKNIRVCLEATGVYHLDLAIYLHDKGIEVMVANPRSVRNFAKALMNRGKDDPSDASALLEYARRMTFTPWNPPPKSVLQLRTINRRALQLTHELTIEKNRLHAGKSTESTPKVVLDDIKEHISHLEGKIEAMNKAAIELALSEPTLKESFVYLLTVKGIGEVSAARLLGELLVLPGDMDVRQWVAHAGLDPRPMQSGTSLNRPKRISKAGNAYLRQILYLPALAATRFEPSIKAYYQHLTSDLRKKPLQAQVAVMRKLLHAIHGMLRLKESFDGSRFYRPKENRPPVLTAN